MNCPSEVRYVNCDICGKPFVGKHALKKHLNVDHANFKGFHCKVCNKKLKGHLTQHMRIHEQDKPHECPDCSARFSQGSQLTVHQRVHSGAKPYRCEVCLKYFAHSNALTLHKRKHTGEKPFQCVLCNASFTQLPHLKKHMLCIHKSAKPYVCKHCKSFHKTKNEFETHSQKCELVKKEPQVAIKPINEYVKQMPVEKIRFMLAILLKRIIDPKRLEELGFDQRLIDDVLIEFIEGCERNSCRDDTISPAEKLKRNVKIFLDSTLPEENMQKFRKERRSIGEMLEELTS